MLKTRRQPPVFRIRKGLDVDPDPAIYVHAAPDSAQGFVITLEVKVLRKTSSFSFFLI
jgi:hypothetical protein